MRQRIRGLIETARQRRATRKAAREERRAAARKEAEELARRRRIYGLSIARSTATAARVTRRRSLFGRA